MGIGPRYMLILGLMFAACSETTSIATEGSGASSEAGQNAPAEGPNTTSVGPQIEDYADYDDFAWDESAVDGYTMIYTQKCGDLYRSDEPMEVWVEGVYFTNPLGTPVAGIHQVTIPELHEVIVARGAGESLTVFREGEFGQPEEIVISTSAGEPTFCFELIDFAISIEDADGRQPVPLLYEVQVRDLASTEFSVGVASCNGDPTFTKTESATEIRIAATSWLPDGDSREDCLDGILVQLAEPLGDRAIVDELSGRTMPILTDEILNAPKPLTQLDCFEDVLDCRANFQILTQSYSLTCMAVTDDGVSPHHFASGELDGQPVDVFQIKSVGVNIMLAVDVPSGECVGGDGVQQPWSVALVNGGHPDQQSRFLCSLADLSSTQREDHRCGRFE
ncbi:MAG: hypothetical protein R8J94_23210 [Acidimicrobiia bacterium]|nr:hypothetical protein [Acidimicrobiia bacterium]